MMEWQSKNNHLLYSAIDNRINEFFKRNDAPEMEVIVLKEQLKEDIWSIIFNRELSPPPEAKP